MIITKQILSLISNISINKFSLADYTLGTEEGEDNQHAMLCNICLDEIKIGKKLICGHIFHLRCIK